MVEKILFKVPLPTQRRLGVEMGKTAEAEKEAYLFAGLLLTPLLWEGRVPGAPHPSSRRGLLGSWATPRYLTSLAQKEQQVYI